jgi:hypothetical protein
MNKFYEIPCHGLISSYGGIGSIVETPEGSVMIMDFESWPHYIHNIRDKDKESVESLSIDDKRLIARLNSVFPSLEYLVRIPTNITEKNGTFLADSYRLISAKIFPEWMHCPRCNRFMEYDEWTRKHRVLGVTKRFERFCPFCLSEKKSKKKFVKLEQVRFIQVSKNGDIADFPWVEWYDRNSSSESCENHELYYSNATNPDSMDSIWIKCKKCKRSVSLTGIFYRENQSDSKRTVLRSSSSVYFPAIVRSLIIPTDLSKSSHTHLTEADYRDAELRYMISKVNSKELIDSDSISLKRMNDISRSISLISVRSLSMVAVLCSFSRLEPIGPGEVFVQDVSRHVTKSGFRTKYLPAIELMGEGFLVTIDNSAIRDCYEQASCNNNFSKRVLGHQIGLSAYSPLGENALDRFEVYKYILLHSLSHFLIKQLEYVCGYPASSLNERIYCSSGSESGLMIYTVAGSEGSYGGLVSVTEKGEIGQLMAEAIERARICTNDPICYNDNSVCFSCSYLPETSCESYNKLLDRALVVDDEFGFFAFLKG